METIKEYPRFVLLCPACGDESIDFGGEDAVFLRVDKDKNKVKTPCPKCGAEMNIYKISELKKDG